MRIILKRFPRFFSEGIKSSSRFKSKLNTSAVKPEDQNLVSEQKEPQNVTPQKENKFSFEDEEDKEDIKEKYKDFNISHIRDQEAQNRRNDINTFNKMKSIFKTDPTKIGTLQQSLLQTNFLRKRKDIIDDNLAPLEIDKNILDTLNIDEPILLYEINSDSLAEINQLLKLTKLYMVFMIGVDFFALFSYNFLFLYNGRAYFFTYLTHSLGFVSILVAYIFKSTRVLSVEYIHKDKTVKITRWKLFTKGTEDIIYGINELEIFKSNKSFTFPLNLRVIKNPTNIYALNEIGIWHNYPIFESLFRVTDQRTNN